MKTITVKELQEQLDNIMEDYDKGDDTHYRIEMDDGKAVMLIPFDGPYETTVKQFPDGDLYVDIPNRLLAKQGWDENSKLEMEVQDGAIILKETK